MKEVQRHEKERVVYIAVWNDDFFVSAIRRPKGSEGSRRGRKSASAETVKEENTETEATSFEKTVVYEQNGITVTITDFKHNTLYYTVKNESEKEIFAEVLKIEVNGQVIRDISNEKDSAYQGLIVVETGAASGEEKEVNRNLFELDELQIKEFEEIGLGFGIIEVTGDQNNPMERRYSEIACTDTITVKTPKGDAAGDSMNEFGVTGEQMEPLNWNEFTDVSSTIQIAVMAASDMPDNLEEVKKEFSSMKDSEPAA